MILTEDEAKTKWCPMGRRWTAGPSGAATTNVGACCIASGCMMWRRLSALDENGRMMTPEVHGYCGLAGKP